VQKPSVDDVITYAQFMVKSFITKYALDYPREHQEEMQQEAFERCLKAYPRLDPLKGWKSFVYNHCRGAVMDYKKFGQGFHEQRWSVVKEKDAKRPQPGKIWDRINITLDQEQDFDLDTYLGSQGIHCTQNAQPTIDWDLVARMASCDEVIHAFAKYILGFEINEIAVMFGISRSKAALFLTAFIDRFDDPLLFDDIWVNQTAFAFGIAPLLGYKNVDQSIIHGFPIGWNMKPVDLWSYEAIDLDEELQLTLFDVEGT
jgi:hypothetical protein